MNTAKIARGVNVQVTEAKRLGAIGFVFLSKKRVSELNALKTSSFYQGLTLNESRDDKIVFRTKLAGMSDADAFVREAVEAAHAVGVGVESETVEVSAKAEVVSQSA